MVFEAKLLIDGRSVSAHADAVFERLDPSTNQIATVASAASVEDGRAVLAHGGDQSALLLVDGAGRLLSRLAGHGADEGLVRDPEDVVVEPGESDHKTRVAVLDADGARVQVFTLDGGCYGSFPSLPPTTA